MNRSVDLRQKLFEYRSYAPIPFLIVMMVVAHPTLTSMIVGMIVVVLGESVRLWGVAIAGSETRTTGPVGGTFLITNGPFAHVRNPLYLGNILMYVGIGVMANTPVLALVALVYFFFQYSLIVSLEEEYLLKTFGVNFVEYCQSVPRFVPTLAKYKNSTHEQPPIDWRRGILSEKRTLQAIGFLVLFLVLLWYFRGQ